MKKYLLIAVAAIVFPLIGFSQDSLKTTTDYFNAGAVKYLNNKSTEALKLVQQGLAIDSSDEKLKKLAELILKKDKQKQQQQQQQNQNKDQDKDKDKDQNKDQQNQDQKNDNKDQQDQNNQLTKSDAERMLDALNNKDKNLQDELQEEKMKATNTKVEKDW
jgi:Ca-activated chloride channel homolog